MVLVGRSSDLAIAAEHGPYFAIWSGGSALPEPWLDLSNGCISTKNPDQPLIEKMLEIARQLGAQVQGDDGEVYGPGPSAERRTRSFLKVVTGLLSEIFPARRGRRSTPPFSVGDRVRDVWGREGLVIEVDPDAEHGLGRIRVRYPSGLILTSLLRAHGLSPAASGTKDSRRPAGG
jgi:hypothetical protein